MVLQSADPARALERFEEEVRAEALEPLWAQTANALTREPVTPASRTAGAGPVCGSA